MFNYMLLQIRTWCFVYIVYKNVVKTLNMLQKRPYELIMILITTHTYCQLVTQLKIHEQIMFVSLGSRTSWNHIIQFRLA